MAKAKKTTRGRRKSRAILMSVADELVEEDPARMEQAVALFRLCSPQLRARLSRFLHRGDRYFILTGSDPRDASGCCPSRDVGTANRLVEAGFLSSFREEALPDACSSTVYAAAGEIKIVAHGPHFRAAPGSRELMKKALIESAKAPRRGLKAALRVFLAALLALSVVLAGLKSFAELGKWRAAAKGSTGMDGDAKRVDATGLPAADRALIASLPGFDADAVQVILFRTGPRCASCLNMERMARLVVASHFPGKAVRFHTVDFGAPENAAIAARLGSGLNTLGLVSYRGPRPGSWRLLTEAVWKNLGDERAFTNMLAGQIRGALAEPWH